VLYTSLERDGALAEIGFRLSLEAVRPSRIRHDIHEIRARTNRTPRFADLGALATFGVDVARHGSFDDAATRALAAAVRFMEFDGLIVPSARHESQNLVVFMAPRAQCRFRSWEQRPSIGRPGEDGGAAEPCRIARP
jgi:hypothetical protein